MQTDGLAEGVRRRQRRALARAISAIENGDDQVLRSLSAALHPHAGRAAVIGMTGAPGAGKSTLTNALIAELRQRDRTVAVLAIDPSSPFSGGALLGDRVRMGDHVSDDGVYIRSMATRGHLGGLAWATPQAVMVLDAAGFDVVIVETVGVGQAEIDIARLAGTTVVVQAPGMGDAIQAAKAGILEVADIHVVNKADLSGADRTAREMQRMLGLVERSGWAIPIIKTSADSGEGVAHLADLIGQHEAWAEASGEAMRRRRDGVEAQVQALVAEIVARRARDDRSADRFAQAVDDVMARAHDPWAAADSVVRALSG